MATQPDKFEDSKNSLPAAKKLTLQKKKTFFDKNCQVLSNFLGSSTVISFFKHKNMRYVKIVNFRTNTFFEP